MPIQLVSRRQTKYDRYALSSRDIDLSLNATQPKGTRKHKFWDGKLVNCFLHCALVRMIATLINIGQGADESVTVYSENNMIFGYAAFSHFAMSFSRSKRGSSGSVTTRTMYSE